MEVQHEDGESQAVKREITAGYNEKYPQNSAGQRHNLCIESWESKWEKFNKSGKQICCPCECSPKTGKSGKLHW